MEVLKEPDNFGVFQVRNIPILWFSATIRKPFCHESPRPMSKGASFPSTIKAWRNASNSIIEKWVISSIKMAAGKSFTSFFRKASDLISVTFRFSYSFPTCFSITLLTVTNWLLDNSFAVLARLFEFKHAVFELIISETASSDKNSLNNFSLLKEDFASGFSNNASNCIAWLSYAAAVQKDFPLLLSILATVYAVAEDFPEPGSPSIKTKFLKVSFNFPINVPETAAPVWSTPPK